MMPDVVVDIGNSRMKWGRVVDGRIAKTISLSLDDTAAWDSAFAKARTLGPAKHWAFTGVVPAALGRFEHWLKDLELEYTLLTNQDLLSKVQGFRTNVREPDRIGIDRLLIAYAASQRHSGHPVVAISVGTAMTVDCVQADGTHVGGAILPGPSLMSRTLHEETAQLPPIVITRAHDEFGDDTESAIGCGISAAIRGAADLLIGQWAAKHGPPGVYIAGGGSPLFAGMEFNAPVDHVIIDDTLTLDGLLRAVAS